MSIPYPKNTKAELVRLLIERDERIADLESDFRATLRQMQVLREERDAASALAESRLAEFMEVCAERNHVQSLLDAARNRQKYESMAYRAKLKKGKPDTFAERSAARKAAIDAYFRAHPGRKVVSDDELRAFCMEGVPA